MTLNFEQHHQYDNQFYRLYQPRFLWVLISGIIVAIIWAVILMWQIYSRPLPVFYATQANGYSMVLNPHEMPSMTPNAILQIAKKAAVALYTFDFIHYNKQLASVRYYFTRSGWLSYLDAANSVIKVVKANKLFISAVVNGPPVIVRQGPLQGVYTWEIQLPLLVAYQSAQSIDKASYTVAMTIINVPTKNNPIGIGIDALKMLNT